MDGGGSGCGRAVDRPCHSAQDSLFSGSRGFTNYRGFFNLAVLLLVLSSGRLVLENGIKYGLLVDPRQVLRFFAADPRHWPNAALLVAANAFLLAALALERALAAGRVSERAAAGAYAALLSTTLALPAAVIVWQHANPLFSCWTLQLYSCLFLKLISYAHVNYWCRSAPTGSPRRKSTAATSALEQRRVVVYPDNLTVGNLYYFAAAPTLCYELNFPRTARIRWLFVGKRVAEVLLLPQVIMGLGQQWVFPLVRNSVEPLAEMQVGRILERMLKLAIPNLALWLILFYWLFHSFLNLVAELLRFADRQFYRDWWNAESVSYFWQNWNIPVHRWCRRHLYKPLVSSHACGPTAAAAAVFFFSAFFHEYMVSVPLRVLRLWAFGGMMAQLPLGLATRRLQGRAGNVLVWLSLIIGQPLAILMYLHDWYALNYGRFVVDAPQ